jgi:ribosomal protein S18 acetylase RimI-like enzyme
MTNIEYTLATTADLEALIDLRIALLTEISGPQEDVLLSRLKKELRVYYTEAINNNTYIGWMAKASDKTVALGGMVIRQQPGNFKNPSGRVAYVLNMYTHPDHRRQGIGDKLLKHLLGTAHEMGITTFELHASKDGEHLYQKNGFEIHGVPTYRKLI